MSPVTCPDRNLQWVMGRAVAVAVLALSLVGPLSASAQPNTPELAEPGVREYELGGVMMRELPYPFLCAVVTKDDDVVIWVSTAEIALRLREAVNGARGEFWVAAYGRGATGPKAKTYRESLRIIGGAGLAVGRVAEALRDTPGGVADKLRTVLADLDAAQAIAAELSGALASPAGIDSDRLRRRADDLSMRLQSGIQSLTAGRNEIVGAAGTLKSAADQIVSALEVLEGIGSEEDRIQKELDSIRTFADAAARAIWEGEFGNEQWRTETSAQLQRAQHLLGTLEGWTAGTEPPSGGWDTENLVAQLTSLSVLQGRNETAASNQHFGLRLKRFCDLLKKEGVSTLAVVAAAAEVVARLTAGVRDSRYGDRARIAERVAKITGLRYATARRFVELLLTK